MIKHVERAAHVCATFSCACCARIAVISTSSFFEDFLGFSDGCSAEDVSLGFDDFSLTAAGGTPAIDARGSGVVSSTTGNCQFELVISLRDCSQSGRTIGFFLNVTGSSSSPPSSAPKLSSLTSLQRVHEILLYVTVKECSCRRTSWHLSFSSLPLAPAWPVPLLFAAHASPQQ